MKQKTWKLAGLFTGLALLNGCASWGPFLKAWGEQTRIVPDQYTGGYVVIGGNK